MLGGERYAIVVIAVAVVLAGYALHMCELQYASSQSRHKQQINKAGAPLPPNDQSFGLAAGVRRVRVGCGSGESSCMTASPSTLDERDGYCPSTHFRLIRFCRYRQSYVLVASRPESSLTSKLAQQTVSHSLSHACDNVHMTAVTMKVEEEILPLHPP